MGIRNKLKLIEIFMIMLLVFCIYIQRKEIIMMKKELDESIEIIQICNEQAKEKIRLLKKIISCESSGKLDIVSKTGDHGALQVNQIHRQRAKELFGFDIVKNPVDSFLYGLYLYETEGVKHWKASEKCWRNKEK